MGVQSRLGTKEIPYFKELEKRGEKRGKKLGIGIGDASRAFHRLPHSPRKQG